MSEDTKALVMRMPLEVFNQGKLELIDEVIAPEFVDHASMPGFPPGREGVKVYAAAVRRAFPDLNNTVNRVIAEDDLVVIHSTSLATMTGDFAGMPASGKQARWDAVHISRVRDGKIVEHWMVQDMLGLFQQLGFVEAPPLAAPAG